MNTSINRCGKTAATITFPPNASLTSGFEVRGKSQQATALRRSKRQTHPQCCRSGFEVRGKSQQARALRRSKRQTHPQWREKSQQARALRRSKRQTHPQCCRPACRCLWVCGPPAGPVAEPAPDWSGGPGTPELSDLEESTPQRNVRESGASLKTQVVPHNVWLRFDSDRSQYQINKDFFLLLACFFYFFYIFIFLVTRNDKESGASLKRRVVAHNVGLCFDGDWVSVSEFRPTRKNTSFFSFFFNLTDYQQH